MMGVRCTCLTTTVSHDNNNHRTSKHASTSWRFDGSPSCLGGSSQGEGGGEVVPVKTHSTPVPTSVEKAVGWSLALQHTTMSPRKHNTLPTPHPLFPSSPLPFPSPFFFLLLFPCFYCYCFFSFSFFLFFYCFSRGLAGRSCTPRTAHSELVLSLLSQRMVTSQSCALCHLDVGSD